MQNPCANLIMHNIFPILGKKKSRVPRREEREGKDMGGPERGWWQLLSWKNGGAKTSQEAGQKRRKNEEMGLHGRSYCC